VISAIQRFLQERHGHHFALVPPEKKPLPFSWILTKQLAIGPMPLSETHWRQLEDAGFQSRFSCCYLPEEEGRVKPVGWVSDRVSLPDHRDQESLRLETLMMALDRAETMVQHHPPVYLHCLAGRERSPLLAVGITARLRNVDMFEALAWVRRCHPMAMPIYPHLELLEKALNA
jgi:hypothetical protein